MVFRVTFQQTEGVMCTKSKHQLIINGLQINTEPFKRALEATSGTDQRKDSKRRRPPLYLATCLSCEAFTMHSTPRRRATGSLPRQTRHHLSRPHWSGSGSAAVTFDRRSCSSLHVLELVSKLPANASSRQLTLMGPEPSSAV